MIRPTGLMSMNVVIAQRVSTVKEKETRFGLLTALRDSTVLVELTTVLLTMA